MKIEYISGIYDDEVFKKIFDKELKPMQAPAKFHRLLSYGIAQNGVDVKIHSVLPISRADCSKKYIKLPKIKEKNVELTFLPMVNIPGIKHIFVFLNMFFKELFSNKEDVLIYDILTVAASLGGALGAKLRHKKRVAVVTDLPQFQPVAEKKWMLAINNKLFNLADGYIFLTKQMDEYVNEKHKPFIVVEGFVDEAMADREHADFADKGKKVLYAGSLATIYGIGTLCRSFVKYANPDEELHIYGYGDFLPELMKLQEENSNIIYHGNRPNREVVDNELDSDILVNPRPRGGEYTKFSFPSKTLEYMAAGTSVISAKLAGIPIEYDEFLTYFDDTDENDLGLQIRKILDMTKEERKELGEKSKSFAMKNKTNVMQAGRIIDFVKTSL